MTNEVIVIDPLGQYVHLLPGIPFSENEEQEIYDGAATVITKPAILIEIRQKERTEFYYFRSVGWNKTLLLITRFKDDHWEAYKCVKNPPSEMLSYLLQTGRQII